MKNFTTLATVCVIAIFGMTLVALQPTTMANEQSHREDDRDNDRDEDRKNNRRPREVRKFMEQMMITRISCELALNDDDTLLLAKKIVQYREEMQTHGRHRYRLMRDLREAIEEERDSAEIKEITEELLEYEKEMEVSRIQAFNRLSEDCTDWERAKLYLAIHDFETEMRRLMDEARQKRKRERASNDEQRSGRSGGPDGKITDREHSLLKFLMQSDEKHLHDEDS